MKIFTDSSGIRYSSRCDLCKNTRVLEYARFGNDPAPECTWCKSIRLKYGNYWYPITDKNKHLFE